MEHGLDMEHDRSLLKVHVRVLYIHFMFNGYRQFQIGTAKIDAQYYFYSLKSSCCIGDLLNEMIIRNTNTNSNPGRRSMNTYRIVALDLLSLRSDCSLCQIANALYRKQPSTVSPKNSDSTRRKMLPTEGLEIVFFSN